MCCIHAITWTRWFLFCLYVWVYVVMRWEYVCMCESYLFVPFESRTVTTLIRHTIRLTIHNHNSIVTRKTTFGTPMWFQMTWINCHVYIDSTKLSQFKNVNSIFFCAPSWWFLSNSVLRCGPKRRFANFSITHWRKMFRSIYYMLGSYVDLVFDSRDMEKVLRFDFLLFDHRSRKMPMKNTQSNI